jgi:GTP cyclohydrolase I
VVDIQNQPNHRRIPIDRVGVKNLRYPISVLDKTNKIQHTVGSINMFVNLPHRFRGTHMSRFIEILNEYHRELHIDIVGEILQKMKDKLNAREAHMEVTFPYFVEKSAPESRASSLMEYGCSYVGTLEEKEDFVLGVEVPVTTLCPCSREMSNRGAHNQRSIVRINIRYNGFVWIEELIELAENSASSPLYALLKRKDEKYVTEHAYDNPMFVEDVVRETAKKLNIDPRITWYNIESENLESIHNHNAYACIERIK